MMQSGKYSIDTCCSVLCNSVRLLSVYFFWLWILDIFWECRGNSPRERDVFKIR